MANVKLAFGYDEERPYGNLADTEEGKILRRRNLAFSRKLVQFFEKMDAPYTFFILGDYLKRCLTEFSIEELNKIYLPGSPLSDINQHSYSHPLIKPVAELNRPILSPIEFAGDVMNADGIIWLVFGTMPCGLRTPYGYETDLSDVPDVLTLLNSLDIGFVSSALRGQNGSLEAELTLDRQPHSYGCVGFPNLIEIPSHGWQDVIFTEEKARVLLNRKPLTQTEIKQYYENLLQRGLALSKEKSPIYICLCLHPWAVMEYDPHLFIHDYIINRARDLKMEIVSYRQIADEIAHSFKT